MKRFYCLFLVLFVFNVVSVKAVAEEGDGERYQEYLDLINTYGEALGPVGDYLKNEIELVMDTNLMEQIEKKTGRIVGIVSQDRYWIWINDPVRFTNGNYGVYGRLIWKNALTGYPGVAVMVVMPDGKIALNCNYRHATRSWELELPRGVRNHGETIYDNAKREVLEETGMKIDQLVLLGFMAADTGTVTGVCPVFMAKLQSNDGAAPEESEAIASVPHFTFDEIKQGIINGSIPIEINGTVTDVNVRDSYLAYAILQAEIQSLLPNKK